jgi:hypothetical protein
MVLDILMGLAKESSIKLLEPGLYRSFIEFLSFPSMTYLAMQTLQLRSTRLVSREQGAAQLRGASCFDLFDSMSRFFNTIEFCALLYLWHYLIRQAWRLFAHGQSFGFLIPLGFCGLIALVALVRGHNDEARRNCDFQLLFALTCATDLQTAATLRLLKTFTLLASIWSDERSS